jgi:hypothetical protein
MEFYSDIKLLYKEFSKCSETNLIGVGPDLSPHYRLNLEQYRRWFPESTLGDPGWSQVIILFDLRSFNNPSKNMKNSFMIIRVSTLE